MSPVPLSALPTLNAGLNATCAVLLAAGYVAIRRRKVRIHKLCMGTAFVLSLVFLLSYVTYHSQVGSVRFAGQGGVRAVYFAILASHTILAALIVPLAVLTLARALAARFDRHVRVARWTLPLWLYVSVTGVVVYWMLYHLQAR